MSIYQDLALYGFAFTRDREQAIKVFMEFVNTGATIEKRGDLYIISE
jgi:hypothetical protein